MSRIDINSKIFFLAVSSLFIAKGPYEQHIKNFHKDLEEFQKQLMRDQIKKELYEIALL